MKKLIVSLGFVLATSVSAQWYAGGTLHDASVSQWNRASEGNQLATMADFAISSQLVQNAIRQNGSDVLLGYAVTLHTCVDEATSDPSFGHFSIAEIGAACMALTGMI